MKKTATLEPGSPEVYAHSKAVLPTYTYNQALNLKIVMKSGAIRTIRSLHASEMRALVQDCVLTATKKGCAAAVSGLDYSDPLDRWYAILELVLHGCSLPLYRDKKEG